MSINTPEFAETDEMQWPTTPSAILVMGKRQGTKRLNKQLWGRTAMAAALWHSAPFPKPYVMFVAADINGFQRTPDADVVKSMLIKRFGVPPDFLILRQRSNCTLIEVRAVRALSRAYRLTHIFAVTHLYHALRAQRYFDEILPHASVIPAHTDILDEIQFPPAYDDLLAELRHTIDDSQPNRFDLTREQIVEWLLSRLHYADPRGRIERTLARLFRPEI